jgi:hypothetical protein
LVSFCRIRRIVRSFFPRTAVARAAGIRTETAMIDANVGGFDMEIFVEKNAVSAFLPFDMASQRPKQTHIAALVQRQTVVSRKTPPFDYFASDGGNLSVGLRKQIF